MSMPVNNLRAILLSGLPVILLITAVILVVYEVMQTKPFATGTRLSLHQAFQDVSEEGDVLEGLKAHVEKQIRIVRDPFLRNETAIESSGQLTDQPEDVQLAEIRLSTIAGGKQGNFCMINGKIFQQGGVGEGFTVVAIYPDHIVLATAQQQLTMLPGQKITLESGKVLANGPEANRATGPSGAEKRHNSLQKESPTNTL